MVSQFLFFISVCFRELLSLSFRNNPRDGSDVEVIQTLDPEVAGLGAHPLVDAVDVVSAHTSLHHLGLVITSAANEPSTSQSVLTITE